MKEVVRSERRKTGRRLRRLSKKAARKKEAESEGEGEADAAKTGGAAGS